MVEIESLKREGESLGEDVLKRAESQGVEVKMA